MKKYLLPLGLLGLLAMTGCSHLGAKAYERGTLAKPNMQLVSDPITASFNDHTYFSKEASSGGASFGGGAWACN